MLGQFSGKCQENLFIVYSTTVAVYVIFSIIICCCRYIWLLRTTVCVIMWETVLQRDGEMLKFTMFVTVFLKMAIKTVYSSNVY